MVYVTVAVVLALAAAGGLVTWKLSANRLDRQRYRFLWRCLSVLATAVGIVVLLWILWFLWALAEAS